MINLTNIEMPLEAIFRTPVFLLLRVLEVQEYENGKKTEKIIGYKFEVVETNSFEKFWVKVLGENPIISQKEIDNASHRMKVTFDNAVAKPYRNQAGSYDLSIKADSISIIED